MKELTSPRRKKGDFIAPKPKYNCWGLFSGTAAAIGGTAAPGNLKNDRLRPWGGNAGLGGSTAPGNIPVQNLQYLLNPNSVFDDFGLVSKVTTSSTRLCREPS